MKIRLLGTGAADGIPSLYGDDPVSRFAREHGGKEIRTRSAAILDDHIKIDLPQDTLLHMHRYGLSIKDWSALIFTHSDDDHCAFSEIQYAMVPFTGVDHLPYTIYANDVISDLIRAKYPDWPIEIITTRSFECYEHGPYRITPIRATHIPGEDCHNLIFQEGGKTLLYGTDTGVWGEETWRFLNNFKLDAMVIECTDGFDPSPYEGHLDLRECLMVVERLRDMKVLKDNARVVTTHHSVRGGATHADLEQALLPHSIEPGYDGIEIEI